MKFPPPHADRGRLLRAASHDQPQVLVNGGGRPPSPPIGSATVWAFQARAATSDWKCAVTQCRMIDVIPERTENPRGLPKRSVLAPR